MKETLDLLKERFAKAEARAARAEKAWESAKSEVNDLRTAIRVLGELVGESSSTASTGSLSERQRLILNLLPLAEEYAQSPAEIFESFKQFSAEDISSDTFRTTIWRMKDIEHVDDDDRWIVHGETGKYWKTPTTENTRRRFYGEPVPQARQASNPFVIEDDILDSEIPF